MRFPLRIWQHGKLLVLDRVLELDDVTLDGRRFVMMKEGDDSRDTAAPAIVVVQHWVEELKRLVPAK